MSGNGLVLCDDLLFASRIRGAAEEFGVNIRMVRDVPTLLKFTQDGEYQAVFLDLNLPQLELEGLVRTLRQLPSNPLLVGFGSHVDKKTLEVAKIAGCDLVLPRSAMMGKLPNELAARLENQNRT